MDANELIGPVTLLDEVLDEIEHLARAQEERHLVVVTVNSGDDTAAMEAKRCAAIARLGVNPGAVDLTVFVRKEIFVSIQEAAT